MYYGISEKFLKFYNLIPKSHKCKIIIIIYIDRMMFHSSQTTQICSRTVINVFNDAI